MIIEIYATVNFSISYQIVSSQSSRVETQELSEMSIYDNIQWDVWINPFIGAVWCWLYSKTLTRGKGFVIRIRRETTEQELKYSFQRITHFLFNINRYGSKIITRFMSIRRTFFSFEISLFASIVFTLSTAIQLFSLTHHILFERRAETS